MKLITTIYLKILLSLSFVFLLFHLLIILKIIPYNITWGGRLKTDEEMYTFEFISILINAFFIYILLQKGKFVKSIFNEKTITVVLWFFFLLFSVNTIGNLLAKTIFEKVFTLVTLLNAFLLWKIIRAKEAT